MENEFNTKANYLSKQMIKLFQERDEYKDKGKLFGLGAGPDGEWRIMFSIFMILLVLGVTYSATVFINVMSGSFGFELVDQGDAPLDKNLLRRNANYYKDRRVNFEVIKTSEDTTPDPSI